MINVSLENETDWIVRGTVTSDVSEINLEDDEPSDEGTDERTIEPEFYDVDLNDDDLTLLHH